MVEIKERIVEIFAAYQDAVELTLIRQAESMADVAVAQALKEIAAAKRTEFTKAFADGITREIITDYTKQIPKGGTTVVERVITPIGDGRVMATTRARFAPWLSDMIETERNAVFNVLSEGQRSGIHPREQAKLIESFFEGTRHNAVTAARTEAQKIRTAARIASARKSGVKYVQYITAGDEAVRPEHAARHMRIYPLDKAPILGEYNCRCTLVPADFAVDELGMPVEQSDAVIIDEDAV